MKKLTDRLRHARHHAGLSQKELAKLLDTRQGRISEVENGRYPVNAKIINLFAEVLEVNPHWLATGEGDMTDTESSTQP